ncbi:Selenide, water dikinase [Hypsibius exemplaris]|uniref:Selenide, water dikinase n=1 Tax=Hypsibius exemplaris TaxID=2072580 RepID=A0A1W0WLI0_HYPEX|nr:Selenide, water dikinase [Hypsibius exemplaris]
MLRSPLFHTDPELSHTCAYLSESSGGLTLTPDRMNSDHNAVYIKTNLFDPIKYGLDASFRLTNFTELKGCGCKVPRDQLLKLLENLNEAPADRGNSHQNGQHNGAKQRGTNGEKSAYDSSLSAIGVGLDSCLIPLRHKGLYLVQTTDFFYPLVDDPYLMGKITCANVLSDIYAMGVTDCDNLLMILATSQKFTPKERDIIMPLIIQGFKDCAAEAGTSVNGGQTVINPWVTIGGTASAVVRSEDVIMPEDAEIGDVLVLTKPLGTQIAVNAHQWLTTNPERAEKVRAIVPDESIRQAYRRAMYSMTRLNRNAARLMHQFSAHAATDVTGFGLFGHAENLVRNQHNSVNFVIHNLPIIANMAVVSRTFPGFGLLQGNSAESSGGLLVCLPRDRAAGYIEELRRLDGTPAWIIGTVEEGDRRVVWSEKMRVIEVPSGDEDLTAFCGI